MFSKLFYILFFNIFLEYIRLEKINRINYVIEATANNKSIDDSQTDILYFYDYSSAKVEKNFSLGGNKISISKEEGYKIVLNFTNSQKKENCQDYTNENLIITNCSISVLDENSVNSEMKFNLISATYPNFTFYENLIEYDYSYVYDLSAENFFVYPQLIQNNFTFEECINPLCGDTKNQSVINQYYFKINASEYIKTNYLITLYQAYILVRNSENQLSYLREIYNILKIDDNIYTLEMDILPDNFDLHLIYSIRRLNDTNNEIEVYLFLLILDF
jgi:hypothetical protein